MKILSIQISSTLSDFQYKDRHFKTGIHKKNISGPIYLDFLGLKNDLIGNLDVHGGEGRALFIYAKKSYEIWKGKVSDDKLSQHGLFGENLTVDEMNEHEIHVGDRFKVGEAIIEATVPRFPCFIFADKLGYPEAPSYLNETGKSGVLFRVIQPGYIDVNQNVELVERSKYSLTMPDFLRSATVENLTQEKLDYFKSIPEIPKITIDRLEFRLKNGR